MKAMHDAMSKMMDDMKAMKPTGNADYDFAMMMKHHHQGAVEMARAELEGGQDTAMRALADRIIIAQQAEIAQLDAFINSMSAPGGQSKYGEQSMGMMTPMSDMKMEGGSLDVMFASMMIPHHQDGVKMAEAYMEEAKNDTLKRIARDIIRTQPQEVVQMQQWLSTRR